MAYASTTIVNILDGVSTRLFLPAIQRPFVWEPEQIVMLFDSLMKDYPISSFLFWDIRPENRDGWDIYRFVENFRYGETHNELVEPDGREVAMVLDGQQRLTSLLIGLRGSYSVKLKRKRHSNPDAWVRQRLYIDLLKEATEAARDDELGVSYGFHFAAQQPESTPERLWIKVGAMLDYPDEDRFDRWTEALWDAAPPQLTKAQERVFRRNIQRLWRMVWRDQCIASYTEKGQSLDRVLDIFVRANAGGTKLSKSDLLLSMITSKWTSMNAREEIAGFVDYLNEKLDRKNDFDKDFVMRSCLVVCDLEVSYKVERFTNANLALIESRWPSIRQAIERTVRLVNRFGIDRDTLTSKNALLPITYYVARTDSALDGSSTFEAVNRERIRRWIISALVNTVFGFSSDQTLAAARAAVQDGLIQGQDFPVGKLNLALKQKRGRLVTFEDKNLDGFLELSYGQRMVFLALSLLYDEQGWGTTSYHIDHIIPRASFSANRLRGLGVSEHRVGEFQEAGNRIGNLQLLLGRENSEKAAVAFAEWIGTRDPGYLDRHLIPADPSLWEPLQLPEFVAAREELIKKRLGSLFWILPHQVAGGDLGKEMATAAQ